MLKFHFIYSIEEKITFSAERKSTTNDSNIEGNFLIYSYDKKKQ